MTWALQRVIEWVIRVVGFFHAHPATDPGDIIIVMQLEAALARAQAMVAKHHKGRTDARAARQLRNDLRKWVQQALVRYLLAIGARASKDRADLAAKFKFPKANASIQVFLVSVKALLAEAQSQEQLLIQAGMSPTLVPDFQKAVQELETADETSREARREHVAARGDLRGMGQDLIELVRVLDGSNRWRFRKDPELRAQWDAVKSPPYKPAADVVVPPTQGGSSAAA